MCVYSGIWQDVEVSFLSENIFEENRQVVVKDPINSDDFNDKQVPRKIVLSELSMAQNQKNKILAMMARKKNKKANGKARKKRRAKAI